MAENKIEAGRWVLIGLGIIVVLELLFGATGALIDYDFAVSLKQQEPVELITPVGFAMSIGFCFGDTLIQIPLFIGGLIGFWRRTSWGSLLMTGALAITAYWPVVWIAFYDHAKGAPGFYLTDFKLYNSVMGAHLLYGLWGLWYVIRHQKWQVKQ